VYECLAKPPPDESTGLFIQSVDNHLLMFRSQSGQTFNNGAMSLHQRDLRTGNRMVKTPRLIQWMTLLVCACGTSPDDEVQTSMPDADGGLEAGNDAESAASTGLVQRPANPRCVAAERPASDAAVQLLPAFEAHRFARPVALLQAPDSADVWYVVEKTGRVVRIPDESDATATVFLDLSEVVHARPSEMGLLGLAFDPEFASNGHVYVSWNRQEGSREYSRISRFTRFPGDETIALTTELVMLDFEQPYENHNGGHLEFGSDGMLYISFGDGGSAGDPLEYGQNRDVLFGKILRIDVRNATESAPYAIPPDNPFASEGGAPEIYAWGLRNVWKFSFDRATGDLWAGDVGQGEWEEVNLIRNGGNYGWRVYEGNACFLENAECGELVSEPPVVEYSHAEGLSVTGGVVYRGAELPSLVGRYVYGDFVSGRIWAVSYDPLTGVAVPELLLDSTGLAIAGFGQGADGEVYVVDYGNGDDGQMYRLTAAEPVQATAFPERLSQTGCFDSEIPSRPASGLLPYSVRVPFWSDGARKERWFAIPDDTTIAVDERGDLELPVGSVVVKHFYRDEQLFETRLMMRHRDGGWAGYSYAWLPDGSDAVWVRGGEVREVAGEPWLFPSSAQCLACHTDIAGRTLGLELAQLAGPFDYPGGSRADQITTLQHIGVLPQQLPQVRPLPKLDDPSESDADRAHAWLHTNCAFCHAPDAPGRSNADFSWYSGDLASLCDLEPLAGDLGIDGATIVSGGDLDRSLLWLRTQRRDAYAMPPLGSYRADPDGTRLLRAFIEGETCDE